MSAGLLTYDEVATQLRVSRKTVELLKKHEHISCHQVGARVFFTQAHVDAYLESVERIATAPQLRAQRRRENLERGRRGLRAVRAAASS